MMATTTKTTERCAAYRRGWGWHAPAHSDWGARSHRACSDDPPQPEASYDTSNYSEFALFVEQVFALMYVDACAILNMEQLPDESDIDVTVDVPTLLLSGGLDVRTPPFRNQEVADSLPNSRVITFPYNDHVQYRGAGSPCASAIVSAFVIDPA